MTSAKMDQARGNWIMQHADNSRSIIILHQGKSNCKKQHYKLIHTHCLVCILSQKTLQRGLEKPGIEPTTFLSVESVTCSYSWTILKSTTKGISVEILPLYLLTIQHPSLSKNYFKESPHIIFLLCVWLRMLQIMWTKWRCVDGGIVIFDKADI